MNIRFAWKGKYTLRNTLVRSDFSQPECPAGRRKCNACSSGVKGKCTISGVVYCVTCNLCTSDNNRVAYIGECKRPIRLRFNEHVLDAKNNSFDTPFGDHFRVCHVGETLPEHALSVEILHRAKDHPNRKIMESLLIRQQNQSSTGMFLLGLSSEVRL